MLYTQQHVLNDASISTFPSDEGFVSMREHYSANGGIKNATALAQSHTGGQNGQLNSLANQILIGDVFSFEWRGQLWIPLFQFNPDGLTSRLCVRQVLNELTNVFDGWTMAVWFIQNNVWLANKKPIDLLDMRLSCVLNAARADRYVAVG